MPQSFCRRVLAGAFPARLGRLKRSLTAWTLGLVVLVGSAVGSAPVAAAASAWWLPSTWVTAAVGSVSEAVGYITGAGGGVEGVSGAQLVLGEWGTPAAAIKISARLEGVLPDGRPVLAYVRTDAGSSDWPQTGVLWGTYGLSQVYLTCADAASTGVPSWTAGSPNATYCNAHGGLARVHQVAYTSGTRQVQAWSFDVGTVAAAMVTTVTCRNLATGVDQVVTESAPAPVAPAPVCPAGTVAVRVQISQGANVLQDSSISTAALSNYGDYLGDPSGWTLVPVPGGGCQLTPPVDRTMAVIPLSQALCDEGGQAAEPNPEPVSCGADIVCVAVQGVIAAVKAVRSAVDAVRGAVGSVVKAVNDGVAGIKATIQSTTDRIVDAINAVKQAILDGFLGVGEKLAELLDQGDGEGEGTGTCTNETCGGVEPGGGPGPGPGEGWSDLGAKWSPLTDGLDELAQAFNPPATGDCRGPGVPLGLNGELSYPLDACQEPMRGVAGIAKMACGVMLMLGAAMTIIRLLTSSLGMNIDLGKGE